MKLIILGAGASFDSIYEYYDNATKMPWRPPLANELFDTRKNFRDIILSYPGGRYYMSQLNGIKDVEQFFENQWEIIEHNRADDLLSNFINLNYCLSHLMFDISRYHNGSGLSNYDVLIQKAYEYSVRKNEEVLFVTFNYDLLLEYSFSKIYYGTPRQIKIGDYLEKPIKIIKPHGSCNWFKQIDLDPLLNPNIKVHQHLFDSKFTLKSLNEIINPEYKVIDSPINFERSRGIGTAYRDFFFPQLLIPLKNKDSFILPNEHENYLNGSIKKVEDILIIGWKGTEYKFLELLKNNLSGKSISVTCVNAGNNDVESAIKTALPKATFNHFALNAEIERSDNTLVNTKQYDRSRLITHELGTFSSYIVNLLQNKTTNFFE